MLTPKFLLLCLADIKTGIQIERFRKLSEYDKMPTPGQNYKHLSKVCLARGNPSIQKTDIACMFMCNTSLVPVELTLNLEWTRVRGIKSIANLKLASNFQSLCLKVERR